MKMSQIVTGGVTNMQSNEILKDLRLKTGKTIEIVAKENGISPSALSMYECGQRTPRDEIKERLAHYYNSSVGCIFFGEKSHEK